MSEKKERDRRREEALTEKKIREEYDRLSKLVLSSPVVLSLFLPHTCWEFEGLTSEEVQKTHHLASSGNAGDGCESGSGV